MKKLASFAVSLSLLALLLVSSLPVGFAAAPRAPGRIPTAPQQESTQSYQRAAQSHFPDYIIGDH